MLMSLIESIVIFYLHWTYFKESDIGPSAAMIGAVFGLSINFIIKGIRTTSSKRKTASNILLVLIAILLLTTSFVLFTIQM